MLFRASLFSLLLVASALAGCNSPLCDRDGDGYCAPDDCDDTNAAVHPDQEDVCDGIDGNCNGRLNDEEATDADGDGFSLCDDCDDERASVNPDAEELCDGHDSDCDGELPAEELVDADGDGENVCIDCDDEDPTRNSEAHEDCDGVDNDCDGVYFFDPEDGTGELTDEDGDGFPPCGGDCDDNDIDAYPGNYEYLTDGVDNDCDGQGDNKPLLSPESDTPENLMLFLEQECAAHGRDPIVVGFENGTVGSPIGPTSLPGGLTVRGGLDGMVPYRFVDASTEPGPLEGTQFASPDGPVDAVQLLFDSPQTLILWNLVGVSPGLAPWYSGDIYWDGVELGGLESIFGTNNADWTWNSRGLFSFQNVGFDRLVIHVPDEGGAVIGVDSIGFCE
jgi:hypothetical protein